MGAGRVQVTGTYRAQLSWVLEQTHSWHQTLLPEGYSEGVCSAWPPLPCPPALLQLLLLPVLPCASEIQIHACLLSCKSSCLAFSGAWVPLPASSSFGWFIRLHTGAPQEA